MVVCNVLVAYYTPAYSDRARMLAASCHAFGLLADIDCLPDSRDIAAGERWRANAHIRPEYLMRKRRQHPNATLLSVDADAIVRADPWPWVPPHAAVAWHDHVRDDGTIEPLPGTLLLRPSPVADDLLAEWARQNAAHPELNDRVNFASATRRLAADATARLPVELCFIFDTHRRMYPGTTPVIEHMQASRVLRRAVNDGC